MTLDMTHLDDITDPRDIIRHLAELLAVIDAHIDTMVSWGADRGDANSTIWEMRGVVPVLQYQYLYERLQVEMA